MEIKNILFRLIKTKTLYASECSECTIVIFKALTILFNNIDLFSTKTRDLV